MAVQVERSGFVRVDRSPQGLSPLAWAQRAGTAADAFGADLIVAEVHQGGAWSARPRKRQARPARSA